MKFSNYLWVSLLMLATQTARAETVVYVHTDVLGSPVLETDANAKMVRQVDHRAYGDEVLGASRTGPGYTGHYRDVATDLVYMQQRYYDPAIGRFLSVDPVTASGTDGVNFNRYWYADNNPYLYVDPDGRVSIPMIADSIKVEAGVEVGLNAQLKLTSLVDIRAGTGSIQPWALGLTLADGYGLSGGSSGSFGVSIMDKFQFGWTPTEYRTEYGRYDVPFRETINPGSFAFGLAAERPATAQGGSASIDSGSADAGAVAGMLNFLLLKVKVEVNVGQLLYGLKADWNEDPGQKGEAERQYKDYQESVRAR